MPLRGVSPCPVCGSTQWHEGSECVRWNYVFTIHCECGVSFSRHARDINHLIEIWNEHSRCHVW